MIFDCHSPLFEGGECEWTVIRGFVAAYNKANGTAYDRAECLDVAYRNSPQPEVRLVCAGESDMVVERKSVVWPVGYVRDHKHFHDLGEALSVCLGDRFHDVPHEVRVEYSSFFSVDFDVRSASAFICDSIERGYTASRNPFPWRLVKVDRGGQVAGDLRGIGLVAYGRSSQESDEQESIQEQRSIAVSGFRDSGVCMLRAAAKKFHEYERLARVILLQFIGDDRFVSDEDIEKIVVECAVLGQCAEIWVAFHDWISEDEFRIGWRRVWPSLKGFREPAEPVSSDSRVGTGDDG